MAHPAKPALYLYLSLLLCSTRLFSQPVPGSQSGLTHSTIAKVQVSYKVAPSTGQATQGASPDLKVRPDAAIVLNTSAPATKIYLKIINPRDNSLVYEASYDTSSPDVTNAQGLKLFYKDAGTIHICDPDIISLAPYRYEVYTQDTQGHSSEIFSAIQ